MTIELQNIKMPESRRRLRCVRCRRRFETALLLNGHHCTNAGEGILAEYLNSNGREHSEKAQTTRTRRASHEREDEANMSDSETGSNDSPKEEATQMASTATKKRSAKSKAPKQAKAMKAARKASASRKAPKVGSVFTREHKGKTYEMKVVEKDGETMYRHDGTDYKSPTAAAKAVTKCEVNGWAFWKIGAEA